LLSTAKEHLSSKLFSLEVRKIRQKNTPLPFNTHAAEAARR
jgi:hypothetical protein